MHLRVLNARSLHACLYWSSSKQSSALVRHEPQAGVGFHAMVGRGRLRVTCVRCKPCQGMRPMTMLHSRTPKANTSAALVSFPSSSSSGGMCVTVPYVCAASHCVSGCMPPHFTYLLCIVLRSQSSIRLAARQRPSASSKQTLLAMSPSCMSCIACA